MKIYCTWKLDQYDVIACSTTDDYQYIILMPMVTFPGSLLCNQNTACRRTNMKPYTSLVQLYVYPTGGFNRFKLNEIWRFKIIFAAIRSEYSLKKILPIPSLKYLIEF